jgi:hypothetical protein
MSNLDPLPADLAKSLQIGRTSLLFFEGRGDEATSGSDIRLSPTFACGPRRKNAKTGYMCYPRDMRADTEGVAMTTNPMPKAKTERLIVTQIEGETLVYDRARDAASCLNALAAKVWWQCDGETSVDGIATALDEDERAVWLALHNLTQSQLLTEAVALPPDMTTAKSRREITRRLGLGAAAFVTSIVVSTTAAHASCGGIGASCTTNVCCGDLLCSSGICTGPSL